MKNTLTSLLTVLTLAITQTPLAQTPPANMSQEDMQAMMAKMQEVQTCLQQVDYQQVQQLEQQARQVQQQVRTLCSSGQNDAARATASDYVNQLMQHPAMAQIKQCRDLMIGMPMMPKDPMENLQQRFESTDVCASLQ
ncbi:MAG: hypothetical protein PVG66_13355 [Chromatiales bacterium]|jgi:hypothetical protein